VELWEPRLFFSDEEGDRTAPCFSAVSVVRVCPYQPDLIAAGGYDGTVRVSCCLVFIRDVWLFLKHCCCLLP